MFLLKIVRIGRGKHQKVWKQEIRQSITPIRYSVIHMYIFLEMFHYNLIQLN